MIESVSHRKISPQTNFEFIIHHKNQFTFYNFILVLERYNIIYSNNFFANLVIQRSKVVVKRLEQFNAMGY